MTPKLEKQIDLDTAPDQEFKNYLIELIMGLSQEKQCALWKELQDCGIIKK